MYVHQLATLAGPWPTNDAGA